MAIKYSDTIALIDRVVINCGFIIIIFSSQEVDLKACINHLHFSFSIKGGEEKTYPFNSSAEIIERAETIIRLKIPSDINPANVVSLAVKNISGRRVIRREFRPEIKNG